MLTSRSNRTPLNSWLPFDIRMDGGGIRSKQRAHSSYVRLHTVRVDASGIMSPPSSGTNSPPA